LPGYALHTKILACAIIGVGLFAFSPSAEAAKGLFNSVETPHKDLKPFPKWKGVLEKYFKTAAAENNCKAGAFNKCHYAKWGKMLEKASKQKPMKQLVTVNKFMNSHKYIVDPINWGVEDYWAVPSEFLNKFGDCEDYSIAKYMSLRALGWKPEDMRVVVLQDMNLKAMHAVLAVKFKGKDYVLDNQISLVVEHNRIHHYKPIFSVSEVGWWRHKKGGSKSVKKVSVKKGGVKKKIIKRKIIKKAVVKKKVIKK
jgi:predicted transglutaminase-like cysteine proteinase